jgi:hypothetical protein
MDADFKARWVSKLREEGRVQGKGCLRNSEGEQCCLDLAMEIAVEDGIQAPAVHMFYEDGAYGYPHPFYEDSFETKLLAKHVAEHYGITTCDPEVTILYSYAHDIDADDPVEDVDYPETVSLSSLNDDLGYDFLRIADLIEEQL